MKYTIHSVVFALSVFSNALAQDHGSGQGTRTRQVEERPKSNDGTNNVYRLSQAWYKYSLSSAVEAMIQTKTRRAEIDKKVCVAEIDGGHGRSFIKRTVAVYFCEDLKKRSIQKEKAIALEVRWAENEDGHTYYLYKKEGQKLVKVGKFSRTAEQKATITSLCTGNEGDACRITVNEQGELSLTVQQQALLDAEDDADIGLDAWKERLYMNHPEYKPKGR